MDLLSIPRAQTDLFASASDRIGGHEGIMRDHAWAMFCLNVEECIVVGAAAVDAVALAIKAHADAVLSGRAPYDPEVHRSLYDLAERCKRIFKTLRESVRRCQEEGFAVQTVEERRKTAFVTLRELLAGTNDPVFAMRDMSKAQLLAPATAVRAYDAASLEAVASIDDGVPDVADDE
jgi:hypothetical protein